MKKYIKTSAAALLLAFLAGCGANGAGSSKEAVTSGTTVPQTSDTAAASTAESAETATLAKYIITCDEIAGKALSSKDIEHPRTMLVQDDVMMSDIIGYDVSLTTDYSVNIQLVSADLFELTVMRVPEGNGKAVLKMLNDRKDYLIEMAAAYPNQVRAAEATIVEHVDDVYYLICSEYSSELEKLVISAIKHN